MTQNGRDRGEPRDLLCMQIPNGLFYMGNVEVRDCSPDYDSGRIGARTEIIFNKINLQKKILRNYEIRRNY